VLPPPASWPAAAAAGTSARETGGAMGTLVGAELNGVVTGACTSLAMSSDTLSGRPRYVVSSRAKPESFHTSFDIDVMAPEEQAHGPGIGDVDR
jgi:hypothetical protein